MRSDEGERGGERERENTRKRDATIHTDGESIVSFISVPRADYLFRSAADRAPRRSPYCDSVSLSYASGKLRAVKASLRQAVSSTKSSLAVARCMIIRDVTASLRTEGHRESRSGPIDVDFLATYILPYVSSLFFHVYVY